MVELKEYQPSNGDLDEISIINEEELKELRKMNKVAPGCFDAEKAKMLRDDHLALNELSMGRLPLILTMQMRLELEHVFVKRKGELVRFGLLEDPETSKTVVLIAKPRLTSPQQ